MSYTYCTLADIKANINTAKTTEDDTLMEYAAYVSERIDLELGSDVPFFLPYIDSVPVLVEGYRVNSGRNTLWIDGYWQSISTVAQGNTTLAVGTDVEGYPTQPYHQLRLKTYERSWYSDPAAACDDPPLAVTIAGTRAYRKRTGATWVRYGTLTAGINDSVTTITVTLDSGKTLSPGTFLKIGDEFLIQQYHASNIVVDRGAHGSTAGAHSLGDVVYKWMVEPPIVRVTARQCGLLLARRGAYDTRGSNELGTPIVYPQDLLKELLAVLSDYAHL